MHPRGNGKVDPPPGSPDSDGSKLGAAKRILRRYGETTSIKGVPKLFKARNHAVRSLWLFAVLFGGSLAVYQLTILLTTYFARPTVTRIEEQYKAPEFPDITLCNQNPMSKHHFKKVSADEFARRMGQFVMGISVNATGGDSGNTPEPTTRAPTPTQAPTRASFNLTRDDTGEQQGDNMSAQEFEEIVSTLFSSSAYFQNLPRSDDIATQIFHMFFQDCRFYSWDMTLLNITCSSHAKISGLFFPDHYACFTISIPEEFHYKVKGASFILYLDQSGKAVFPEYHLNMFHPKSTGARVIIHPQDTLPMPGDGDTIAPGQETTIRLFPHKVERLSEPYGDCLKKRYLEYPDDHSPDQEEPRPKVYTKASCLVLCQQEASIEQCGCLDIVHTYTHRLRELHNDVPYCGNASLINLEDGTMNLDMNTFQAAVGQMLCAIRARASVNNSSQCACLPACEQTIYTKSFSQSPWPIRDYQLGFFQRYLFQGPLEEFFLEYRNISAWYFNTWPEAVEVDEALKRVQNKIEDSFLQLNVLFTNQIEENIAEKPLMTWDKILAHIGGTMNLWIGITFITVIEMSEVLYYLFWLLVGAENKTPNRNGPQSVPLTATS